MNVKHFLTGIVLALMVVGLAGPAFAAEEPADYAQAPPAHWHDVDNEFMQTFHNPAEGVTMGLDLRLREVYARDIFSLNDSFGDPAGNYNNYHWQRYRTRWSAKWAIDEDIDLNTRLVWEFWGHCAPDESFSSFLSEQSYDFDEAIFDHLNVQIRNAFDQPLTLTIGRQDIIFGTGWLVLDGTPGDGSRTIFFDALRGTYDLSDATKLDLIYIQQYDSETKYLKPFNHSAVRDRRHLTQYNDEVGFITYLTNKTESGQQREAYYIYKSDEDSDWGNNHGSHPGVEADIHTIGGRLAGPIDDSWSYSVEVAKQWGDRSGDSLQALGTNNRVTYAFHDERQSQFMFDYEYMSGDDPDTSKDEQFDSLWGDWPQYGRGGDLQSYMWTFEGDGIGNVTNLHRLGLAYSFKPAQEWTMLTQYNLMWADENSYEDATIGGLNFSETGSFRGHMITGLLTYQCCEKFRTQFLVDYFIPGSYYKSPSDDNAMFARINMEWTF